MSGKGKRRQKDQAEASERRAKRMEGGGKSKYAKKHSLAARGKPSKGSPFYVSPEEETSATEVGASMVDSHGRPVRIETDERGFSSVVEKVVTEKPKDVVTPAATSPREMIGRSRVARVRQGGAP